MTLKKASSSLPPHDQIPQYNSIFVAVGTRLLSYINAQPDSSEWEGDDVYVSDRLFAGVDDSDVLDFARNYRREVLGISGRAGVGKSTFVTHCEPKLREAGFLVLKFNLVNKRLGTGQIMSIDELIMQFRDHVTERLDIEMNYKPSEWWQFVLERRVDRAGQSTILLEQMRRGILDGAFYKDLRDFVGAISFVDATLLRIQFLRELRGKRPIIVLDNVDLLDVRYQKELLLFATYISAGSAADKEDCCPVIIALRPDTLEQGEASGQFPTKLIQVGKLSPPRMEIVFKKRLDYVIDHWQGKLLRGPNRPIFDGLSELEARDRVKHWGDALLSHKHSGKLVNDLHAQTGYNTRITLLAIGNYLASGHHTIKWPSDPAPALTAPAPTAAVHTETLAARLTPRLVYKALLLGTRAYYMTNRCWAHNLFFDGNDDEKGTLITCRILKQFLIHSDRPPEQVISTVRDLFGYDEARTRARLTSLQALMLLEPAPPQDPPEYRLRITDPGRIYMQTTLKEFEYLQHVLVDTWVDKRYLVPASSARDENGVTRLHRVVRFALWIRELELADYVSILRNGREELFATYYGDDMLAEALIPTLRRAAARIPGVDGSPDLTQDLTTLSEGAPFKALRAEALSILEREAINGRSG